MGSADLQATPVEVDERERFVSAIHGVSEVAMRRQSGDGYI
jgi:hypothetical protein